MEFLCLNEGCTLQPFYPYLELGFAMNLLFGVWHGLHEDIVDRLDLLTENHRKLEESEFIQEEVSIARLKKTIDGAYRWLKRIWLAGRVSGLIIAFWIAWVVLTTPPETGVASRYWALWFYATLFLTPSIMLFMLLIGYLFSRSASSQSKTLEEHLAKNENRYSAQFDTILQRLREDRRTRDLFPDDPAA